MLTPRPNMEKINGLTYDTSKRNISENDAAPVPKKKNRQKNRQGLQQQRSDSSSEPSSEESANLEDDEGHSDSEKG